MVRQLLVLMDAATEAACRQEGIAANSLLEMGTPSKHVVLMEAATEAACSQEL